MPTMDMSAALTNPYTLDTVLICRRKIVTNKFGEGKLIVTHYPGVRGVVTPDGENELIRSPDQQHVIKTITVISKFAIRTASGPSPKEAYQADLIVWRGTAFVVEKSNDYGAYGTGFVKAVAEAIPLTQLPPETVTYLAQQVSTAYALKNINELYGQGPYGPQPYGGGVFNGATTLPPGEGCE